MNAETQIEIDEAKGTFLAAADEADLPAALASKETMRALVARVEAQARAALPEPDTTTAAGRQAIRSTARKVTRSKTAIDAARLALTKDLRQRTETINATAKIGIKDLDDLAETIRQPLTDWEAADAARQAALQARLDALDIPSLVGMTADELRAEVDRLAAIQIDETWQEVRGAAAEKHGRNLAAVQAAWTQAVQIEAERAELEEFRRQKAEREAEQKRVADEKAAAERAEAKRIAAEAEAKRVEEERQAAEERAAQAARERAEREAQEKIEAERRARVEAEEAARRAQEQAEQDRLAAEERARAAEEAARIAADQAERDRIAAAEKAAADAKAAEEAKAAAVEAALEAERMRRAEERRQEEEERERRAADVARRAAARAAIAEAVLSLIEGVDLTPGEIAEVVADALMEGKVPHALLDL